MVNLDEAKVKSKFNEINSAELQEIQEGIEYSVSHADERTVVVLQNAGSEDAIVTLKAPVNGSYAGAVNDEDYTIKAGEISLVEVESAVYADAVTEKVTIAVGADATIKATIFEF